MYVILSCNMFSHNDKTWYMYKHEEVWKDYIGSILKLNLTGLIYKINKQRLWEILHWTDIPSCKTKEYKELLLQLTRTLYWYSIVCRMITNSTLMMCRLLTVVPSGLRDCFCKCIPLINEHLVEHIPGQFLANA